MSEYRPPLRDMQFLLEDVFDAAGFWDSLPAFADLGPDLALSVLGEVGKLAAEMISPLRRTADAQGVCFADGEVKTPDGYREAYRALSEGGWGGLGGNPAYGGEGMSYMVCVLINEMLSAADNSFSLYSGLTDGLAVALDAHASEALKQQCLPQLYSRAWSGAMCLTEAQAGTDLGLIRTRAVAREDGSYALSGSKVFTTAGEHDLSENILYLVLARLPDAPPGSRGISMFLVHKFLPDESGAPGARNGVRCLSVEEKMGIHGSATCVMQFEDATAYLVGEPHRGLAAMFTMMNYERLMVGLQGLGCADAAYQKARDYALERLQGRAAGGDKSPDQADPIIVHPDVRRMLLTQKAFNEGARALGVYIGMQMDLEKHGDEEQKRQAGMMVELLTPIAKAFFTDKGFDCCVLAQQVFGGYGYVRETGVEQLVRDVRITQIYEGTNGIQALDLVQRKVTANEGLFVEHFIAGVRHFAEAARKTQGMQAFLNPLERALALLEQDTRRVVERREAADETGAVAVAYLHLFGHVALAWAWARMAHAALDRGAGDDPFYAAKCSTAAFYMQHLLPQIQSLSKSIEHGARSMMELAAEQF